MMTLPIPRNTVAEIVRKRNIALDLYQQAYDAMEVANNLVRSAQAAATAAAPITGNGRYSYHLSETINRFYDAIKLPDREFYLKTARRVIDTSCWQHVIQITDLESLMDKEAKDQLHRQMMEPEPARPRSGMGYNEIAKPEDVKGTMPDFTEESVVATLESFAASANLIFRRGIANAFSKLDRRFRSHDGFKIKHRIIFTHAFSEYGHWRYDTAMRDTIYDVERAFRVIDGQPPRAVYGSILQQIENERGPRHGKRQSVHEGDFFRVRVYENGNAHLWFTRKDLLDKVNKILADWYGEVIGDDSEDVKAEDPFAEVKTTPARYFGFYPTPDEPAATLLDQYEFGRPARDGEKWRVLEPSAGTGNLARRCLDFAAVDCCEVQPHLAEQLRADNRYGNVWCQDFMALDPSVTGLYDRVVMNPPFDRERDIDHVMHAWKFVKPGGMLHAIMSAGTEFRETRKAEAFRQFATKHKTTWRDPFSDLPPGSFSEAGTNVNTVIVRLRKPTA